MFYLARYGDGASTLLQAVLRLESSLADAPDLNDTWRERYGKTVEEVLADGNIHLAFRVRLQDRRLQRLLFLTAGVQHQEQLQRLARHFVQLNDLARDGVFPCADRAAHDAALPGFPGVRCAVDNQPYPFQACQLLQNFRLAPVLDRLLVLAYQKNWRIGYQANFGRLAVDPEHQRQVRKNLVRIEECKLPAKLLELQRQLASGFTAAGFHQDEFLGCDPGEPRQQFAQVIAEHFQATLGPLGYASSPIRWDDANQLDDFLATGFPSCWMGDPCPLTRAGSAVGVEAVRTLLRWRPPKPRAQPAAPPPAPRGTGGHEVFISYSSKDAAVAQKMLAALEKDGKMRCWMAPRDIQPGGTWAGAIIDAIESCRLMVLIFSKHSNESPQVVREVERAVNKRLPMIPFRIDNLTPTREMAYFLGAVHWFDAHTGPLEGYLDRLALSVTEWLKKK